MELELKFALPSLNPQLLEKQLARVPLIGRRKPQREQLHNTYYDTPDHALKAQGMALRVRQLGDAQAPRWVQTLKVSGAASSALSRRGEWEAPLPRPVLDATLLHGTPWTEWDRDGAVFAALQPVFTTTFERLSWVLSLGQDAGQVEIALDRGAVVIDGHTTALCELEIELLHGDTQTLFDVASQIAQHLALLPLHVSKAERAYRLAQGTLYAPLRAKPPALHEGMDFAQVARSVLCECFLQFTANLNNLCHSDAPEVLHQARVGWRRFKSLLKLLRQLGDDRRVPDWAALKPLLQDMTALRDLDVAATEVLPLYAAAYPGGDAQRMAHWAHWEDALTATRAAQRDALRHLLAQPAVGQTLLQLTRWLETGAPAHPGELPSHPSKALGPWLQQRVKQLAKALKTMPVHTKDPAQQHEIRILCKRLRYSVESLRPLLPAKKAERWYHRASQQQTRIGLERDRLQALHLAQRLGAAEGIVEFMRGAAFGAQA